MPIAVCGYTLRFHMHTPEQVLSSYAKIAAMGYDGIEMGFHPSWSLSERVDHLAEYGLKLPCLGGDLTKPEELMRQGEAFGVKTFSVGSIPGNMLMSVDGVKAFAAQLSRQAAPFAQAGCRLQYHNHSQEFRNFPELGGKPALAILMEETDPQAVCFELDTHWLAGAGCDPAQWIRWAKGRMEVVHFKDYAINWKDPDTGRGYIPRRFAEIGQGNIHWPAVTEACREAGVHWYSVEQDQTPGCEFDSLKTSLDYMRGVLGIR